MMEPAETGRQQGTKRWGEGGDRDLPVRELHDVLAPSLTRHLRLLGVRAEDVEDQVQDVFHRLLTDPRPFSSAGEGSPWGWLFGRALRGRASRGGEGAPHRARFDEPNASERRRRFERLREAVRGLSPELRTVFVLHEAQDFTPEQIGEVLKGAVGVVHVRLRRARAQIALAVLGDGEEGRRASTDDPSPVGPRWAEDEREPAELRQALRDWRDPPLVDADETKA